MAIAFRAVGTVDLLDNNALAITSTTPGTPAGVVATDILVAVITFSGGTGVTVTPPSGWTLINRTNSTTTYGTATYWALGNVASFTFSISGATGALASIAAAYSGVDNTTPMDVTAAGQTNGASVTDTAPTITTVTANAQVLFLAQTFDALGGAVPTWTAVFGALRGSGGIRGVVDTSGVAVFDAVQSVAGATGSLTETQSRAVNSLGILAALRPSGGAGALDAFRRSFGPRAMGRLGTGPYQFERRTKYSAPRNPFTLSQSLAGTLTSSGALLKQARKTMAGTLTSSGALLKQANKVLAGTLTSSGALLKQANKVLAGTLTSSGALVVIRIVLVALAGTLTSSGALLKQVGKPLAGTLTSSGALLKTVLKVLAGTLTSSGALLKRALKILGGTLTPSGALAAIRIALLALSGTLTSSGALLKQVGKPLAGTLTSSGAIVKQARKVLSGTLTSGGALLKRAAKSFAGALTSSGALVKRAGKFFAGTLSSLGALVGVRIPAPTDNPLSKTIRALLVGLQDAFQFTGTQDSIPLLGTQDGVAMPGAQDNILLFGQQDAFALTYSGELVPAIQDFSFPVGDDSDIPLTLKNNLGTAFNLTNCTVVVTLRQSAAKGGATVLTRTITITSAVGGLATWTLIPGDTSALPQGQYDLKVKVTTNAPKTYTLITGVVTLTDRRV